MNNPIVTHKGKQYTVSKLANCYEWRLDLVDSPRQGFTLNREQMVLAGFGHIVEASNG